MHSQVASSHNSSHPQKEHHALFVGAIIDAQGREITITEGMIQQACDELAKHYALPQQRF
jgi:hypothetical protein